MRKVLPKVKKIINKSIEEAKLYNDSEIKIEHIITALINDYNNDAIMFPTPSFLLESQVCIFCSDKYVLKYPTMDIITNKSNIIFIESYMKKFKASASFVPSSIFSMAIMIHIENSSNMYI